MSFSKISEFEKSFPEIKDLTIEQKEKALDIFNALVITNDTIDEGEAVAIAISRAKKLEADELNKMVKPEKKNEFEMFKSKNLKASDVLIGKVELLQGLNDPRFSTIEILRTGRVQDRDLDITEDMLKAFVKNFHDNVYGSDIQVNLAHNREGEAAGWIRNVFISGDSLFAEIDWTELGQEKIKKRQYRFTSAELALSTVHHKTGEQIDNVLIGVALTNIPAVKGLDAVQLSEDVQLFLNSYNTMEKLKKLYVELSAKDKITKSEFLKFSEEAKKVEGEEKKEAEGLKTELEQKVEEEKPAVVPEKTEEEKKKEEEEKKVAEEAKKAEEEKKEAEKLTEKAQYVSLADYNRQKEEISKLQEKIEYKELCEKANDKLYLSEKNDIGFSTTEQLDEATNFMKSLSQAQQDKFIDLIGKVRTVDFSVIGSSNSLKKKEYTQEAVVELSEKILNEKFSGDTSKMADAQKMAMKELSM